MISMLTQFLAGLFSSAKAQDVAIDAIKKLGGLDSMSDKERSEFLLQYMQTTQYQSPTRRFIAILFVVGLMLFTGCYALAGLIEMAYVFFSVDTSSLAALAASENIAKIAVKPITQFKNDLYVMAKEVIFQPVNLIVGFYFAAGIASNFKKGG